MRTITFHLFSLILILGPAKGSHADAGNATCMAVVQEAVETVRHLSDIVADISAQVPSMLKTIEDIRVQVAETTKLVESRTESAYLAGTFALATFAAVIVGMGTIGVWKMVTTRIAGYWVRSHPNQALHGPDSPLGNGQRLQNRLP
ncbi:MAG: hypothetical protein V4534_08075 [Myxococcota bacterium]